MAPPASFAAAQATSITHGTYIAVGDRPSPEPLTEKAGELAGLAFAVKDNIDVAGMVTTGGSPLLAKSAPSAVDAGVVGVLRAAGAIVVGKTNLHELAFGVTSNNAVFGPVRNPHDPERSAGGSSGGSAAAVALGAADFALGTDTGGSVSIPSSFCGVVGFRPTTGRYPGDGLVNLSWSRDTVGLHTRTVADAITIDRVITRSNASPRTTLAGVRLGVPRERYANLDSEVEVVAEATLASLEAAGVRLVDVEVNDRPAFAVGLDLVMYEAERLLMVRARAADPSIRSFAEIAERVASPDVRQLMEQIANHPVSATAYQAACSTRARLRREYAAVFEKAGVTALVSPSSPVLPPAIGENNLVWLNGREAPLFATITRTAEPGTVAGVPMLSIPSGWSAGGLPIGMTYEGPFFEDGRLLAIGAAIES